jgi:hypothetical protein
MPKMKFPAPFAEFIRFAIPNYRTTQRAAISIPQPLYPLLASVAPLSRAAAMEASNPPDPMCGSGDPHHSRFGNRRHLFVDRLLVRALKRACLQPFHLVLQFAACVLLASVFASAFGQTPALNTFRCAYGSIFGSFAEPCELTLTAPAGSGGLKVQLSSNNKAISIPTAVTFPAGWTTYWFQADVAVVSTTQIVTLTATQGNVTETFAVTLNAAPQAINVNSVVNFGNVSLKSPATQSLTLTSSGEDALTISAASVIGAEFALTGSSLPVTLKPNQTTTLDLEFDPTQTGKVAGQLVITSNASKGSATVVYLIGTGESNSYQVQLSWSAPANSPEQIAGYRVFRANDGSTSYTQLTSSDTATTYTDGSVQAGTTYSYYVESVDSAGAASSPSSKIAVSVP